jgi:hypothetical protein
VGIRFERGKGITAFLDLKGVVLHKVVMTLKNLLGFKNLAGLPLLYAGLP